MVVYFLLHSWPLGKPHKLNEIINIDLGELPFMNKSIIELIAGEESAKAVSVMEKTLGKKLFKAISEQATSVARKTYGTVRESFGADEQPEFMNPADNTYAVFFANALKKFGVNGPEDFRDEATKQQFFQYVDNNWKAQDSVQGVASQAAPGTTMDQGTQTQLPSTAMQPHAPQGPMQTSMDTTAPTPGNAMGGTDPSLSAMSPTGNANSALTPGSGDDGQLDNVQNTQQMGGVCQSCGQPMPEPQTCQCCGQPMPTAGGNPNGSIPGQPTPGQQVAPGADMGDDDSDPDLEIGDEDQADGQNDDFGQDPEDEQGLGMNNTNGDIEDNDSDFGGDSSDGGDTESGDGGGFPGDDDQDDADDEDDDAEADDDDQDGDNDGYDDENDDDPLSDPYSVSPEDFDNDDDDQDNDNDDDPDLEIGDDDGDDDDDDDEDSDDDSDDDDDDDGDPYDDEDDSDDDYGDDDQSDDDGDDEVVVAPPKKKSKSKNPFAEGFGYKEVVADNKKFIVEFLQPMIKQTAKTDPLLNKKLKMANQHLGQFGEHCKRNHRAAIKQAAFVAKDPTLSPEEKAATRQHISDTLKADIKHHKIMAKRTKAAWTGKIKSAKPAGHDVAMPGHKDAMPSQQKQRPKKSNMLGQHKHRDKF